jgi:tetratricopeptide (TPR) repeat protein
MRRFFLVLGVAFLACAAAVLPASAQSDTPRQLQAMIANGQAQAALAELQSVLQAHPTSGVAWYLTAEAQDALGNEQAARNALNNAQNYAPGLPFANPNDLAALQAHLINAQLPVQPRSGISPVLGGIIVLVVLFIVFRMFRRRRYVQPYGQGGFGGGFGPGPGPYPYNQGPGMGIGGSLLGGLAAGAGFAAGERVIGDMFGGNNNPVDPAWGNQPMPDRDDGLQGSPGWDAGAAPDDNNFDPGNNW